MFCVVGLGNPGGKYAHTRHNVGFDVVEMLSQKHDIPLRKLRCKAVVGEGWIGSQRVVLAQPQTFMNLSGQSVTELVNWYKCEPEELILVYDDVDLAEGKLRFRPNGSSGTHNGMRNIIYLLGYDNFPRFRVGIGRPAPHWDMKDWVLSGFDTPELRQTMFDAYGAAASAIEAYITQGTDATHRFLSRLSQPPKAANNQKNEDKHA